MADDARLQVVLEAKIDKLTEKLSQANRAVYGASSKMQKDLEAASSKWDRMFLGEGPGKALERVFSRARFATIEEGGARIGVFGNALEALGPGGLVAAAGIAAVGIALEKSKEAIEYADRLDDTAHKLHVTTDALQEFRYAIRLTGGEEAGADAALEAFSVTLGKAQAGLPKAIKAFKELGFTKEQVKSFADVETALTAVTAKIAGLGKNAQKDAVIDQLGLTGLKSLIEEGVDAMSRLREEAHKVGLVMDADLIKKGAEAHDKYETLSKVIDVQLKSALVDLGPVLVQLLGFLAQMATKIGEFADKFQELQDRRSDLLKKEIDQLTEENTKWYTGAHDRINNNRIIDADRAELARRDAVRAPPPTPPKAGRDLIDLDAGKEAEAAAKAALARRVRGEQLIDQAGLDELRARQELVTGIRASADLREQEIEDDRKRKNNRLDGEVAEKKIDAPDALIVKLRNDVAADELKEANRRDEADKIEQASLGSRQEIAGYYNEIAGIESDMAKSAKERLAIELRLLEDRQRNERDRLSREQEAARVGKSGQDLGVLLGEQAAATKGQADLHAAQKQDVAYRNRTPLQAYQDQLKNLDDLIQNDAISAFTSLADSIGDTTAKLLHLKGPLGQFFGQLISLLVQRQGSGLLGGLLGAIPHFATGTNFAPGGMASINEFGREGYVPPGAQLIPSSTLQAINSMGVPTGRTAVQQTIVLDMKGAVVTEELIRQVNQTAATYATQAGTMAYKAARRDIPAMAAQRAGSRMGRG